MGRQILLPRCELLLDLRFRVVGVVLDDAVAAGGEEKCETQDDDDALDRLRCAAGDRIVRILLDVHFTLPSYCCC